VSLSLTVMLTNVANVNDPLAVSMCSTSMLFKVKIVYLFLSKSAPGFEHFFKHLVVYFFAQLLSMNIVEIE
jgi:hypothetical protein